MPHQAAGIDSQGADFRGICGRRQHRSAGGGQGEHPQPLVGGEERSGCALAAHDNGADRTAWVDARHEPEGVEAQAPADGHGAGAAEGFNHHAAAVGGDPHGERYARAHARGERAHREDLGKVVEGGVCELIGGTAGERRLQGLDGEVVAIHPERAAEALVDRLHRPVVGLARQAGAEQALVVEALVTVGGQAPFTAERVGQGRDLIEHQPLARGHPVGSAARRPAEAEVVGVRRVVVDQVAEAPAQLHGVLGTVPDHAEGLGAIGAAVEDPRKGRFALTGIAEALAGGVAEDLQVWAFGAALHAAHRQVEVAVEVDVAPAGHGSLQAGKGDREPLEAAATAHQRITQELGGEQAGDGILAAEQQIHIAVVVDVGPGG